MTLDPNGPAALVAKAIGTSPTWAVTEKRIINDHGEYTWVYWQKFLTHGVLSEIAALTDPRVGWLVDIRPVDGVLRIRARRKDTA